jgi:hypothetical protein
MISIEDVPCGACQQGYSREHFCDFPSHCPCDQTKLHHTCTCETCKPTRAPGDYAPKTDPQWAVIDEAIDDSVFEVEVEELLGGGDHG